MTDAMLLPGFEERRAEVRGIRLRYYIGGPKAPLVGADHERAAGSARRPKAPLVGADHERAAGSARRPFTRGDYGPEGADPLVLVHGLGGSAANWALLAPELARTRRVLAVDLPGHAGSDPLPAAPSLAHYADRLGELVEREGFAGADLVGHSLGGLISLRLALRRPELVRSVVLAAAAGISSSTRWAERILALLGWLQPGRKISPYWRTVAASPALRRAVFGYWGAADPVALSTRAVEGLLRDVNLHTDTASAWRALTRDDPRRDLHEVECPCLVLWGARDNQLPLADAFDYARRLGAPLRVIAECGHLLIVERPDSCLDAIERFLASR